MIPSKRTDEHDPDFDPSVHEAWEEIPGPHWIFVAIALGLVVALLSGCDDFDRRLAEQEFRQRVFNACIPEEGQRVVVALDENSFLHFTYIDIGPGRYGRSFPHTENRIAIVEPM